MTLQPEQLAAYRTLIDAAQQNPGALSLSEMQLSGKDVAVVAIAMPLKMGGGSDLMPLAILTDDATAAMLRYHGQAPGAQSPNDYDDPIQ